MHATLRHLPNVISSLRILLVVPIALTLWRQQFALTLAIFGVAAASDAVDGFLARRFAWQTALGALLDPLADKLMLATVFVVLAAIGLIPAWLTAAVLTRDIVIVAGAIAYRTRFGELVMAPSTVSKFNTLCQILFVLCVIMQARFAVPAQPVIVLAGALAFATTVISGIDYVLVWSTRARALARAAERRA